MYFIPSPSLHPEELWDEENVAQGGTCLFPLGTFPWQLAWYHNHDPNYHQSGMGNFPPLLLSIGVSNGKDSACNAGDLGSIPGSGRYTREGNGNPLHYVCQENSTQRGVWWATAHRVTKVGHDWATNIHYKIIHIYVYIQFSSVAQSCPTLCDPMNHSRPGLPVLGLQLMESIHE